jgi:heptose I phosphotransferase
LRRRDLLRFMAHYTEGGLRRALREDADLWREVAERAQRLYSREHGCKPPSIEGVD